MDKLTSDLTVLGNGIADALGDPYKQEDLGTKTAKADGLDLKTNIEGAKPQEAGEFDQLMETQKGVEDYQMKQALPLLSAKGGSYDTMFTSDDDLDFEPSDYVPKEKKPEEVVDKPLEPDVEAIHNDTINSLKQSENPNKLGMKGDKFFPIDSIEGQGNLNKAGKEIGYGIQVKPEWLSRDPDDWPIIDGQQTDVTQGLTERQVTGLMENVMKEETDKLSKGIKDWDSLRPEAKAYFVSFAYNAGGDSLKDKNHKAYDSLSRGFPVDAMLQTFDYWNVTKNKEKTATRGLLNRRLNDYNKFAESMGVPKAVSYDWGNGSAKVKFDGKLTEGADKYFGKDSVTFKSKNMKETDSQTYQPNEGVFN